MRIIKKDNVKYFKNIKIGETFKFKVNNNDSYSYYFMKFIPIVNGDTIWNAVNLENGEPGNFAENDVVYKVEAHIEIDKEEG